MRVLTDVRARVPRRKVAPGGATGATRAADRRPAARRWRGAVAVVAGALPALAFPAPALWWLAYGALVPWLLLVRDAPTARRAAYDGWLGGTGFMVAVHHWLLPSLNVFTVVIAALLGALWAPWAVLVRRVLGGAPTPGRALVALAGIPSGWLAVELVRSWQGLGGPWGVLGASQWQVPPALRLASLGGVWLVSAVVVAVNTAVVLLVLARHDPRPAVAGLLAVALAAGAAWHWAPRPQPAGRARIAVVQPGVIPGTVGSERRFDREERLTAALAGQHVDLVVWGESSVGYAFDDRPDLARRIAALSRRVGADILVNVDARQVRGDGGHGILKTSVLVGPDGPTGDRYDKMRLVPFGEYIPARSVLGWATRVGRAAGEDRVRGRKQVVMDVDARHGAAPSGRSLRIGPLICFETAFPDMSRHLAGHGAGLLLAQSSTASFQGSWAPAQHASLAALRAAETGRPMVHATLTGISAAFGPDGRPVGARLGTAASGAAVYEVPLARGTTPYVRFGDWPLHAALLVLAGLGLAEGARSLRRTAPPRRSAPARTTRGWPARPGR